MKRTIVKWTKAIVRNLLTTYENKITALVLMFLGWLSAKAGDGTGFVFTLMLGIPAFFSKKKVFTWGDRS